MGLNRTKTIPNSTDVWWEMSEYENMSEYNKKYIYTPSCKKKKTSFQYRLHRLFFC